MTYFWVTLGFLFDLLYPRLDAAGEVGNQEMPVRTGHKSPKEIRVLILSSQRTRKGRVYQDIKLLATGVLAQSNYRKATTNRSLIRNHGGQKWHRSYKCWKKRAVNPKSHNQQNILHKMRWKSSFSDELETKRVCHQQIYPKKND